MNLLIVIKNRENPEMWTYEKGSTETYREALNRILKRGDFVNEGDMIVVDIDDEVAFINEYENGICSSASATIMCSVRVLKKIGYILSEVEEAGTE